MNDERLINLSNGVQRLIADIRATGDAQDTSHRAARYKRAARCLEPRRMTDLAGTPTDLNGLADRMESMRLEALELGDRRLSWDINRALTELTLVEDRLWE